MLEDLEIPGVPDIASRVLALIEDPCCSFGKLESVIFKDQSLAAEILKIANAPSYRTGQCITTLTEAFMLVGLTNLVPLVAVISLNRQIAGKAIDPEIARHAVAVSNASLLSAAALKSINPEEALMAGLLHDVGITVLSANIPGYYKKTKEKAEKENKTFVGVEEELLGFNHCVVGGIVARKWKLPHLYQFVIKTHHDSLVKNPNKADQIICPEDVALYAVRVANHIAHEAGIGAGKSPEKYLGKLLKTLGMSASRYEDTLKAVKIGTSGQS